MRLNKIYNTYKDDVQFFHIYIREAHPDDGWRTPQNLEADIRFREPRSNDERTEVASVCQTALDLQMPMLIDSIANEVEENYIAMPLRVYLIDREGKIAFNGNQGPLGFDADAWESAIKEELNAAMQ